MSDQATTAATQSDSIIRRLAPELSAFALLLVAAIACNGIGLWHDITWQLWIARQLNAGIPLYSWIMEVNPPLWYWMAQPVDLLSAATDWPATRILTGAVFLLIGISLALCASIAAAWPARQRAWLYFGLLAGTILVVMPDFAQREHLTLIASIPYALLIARRAERQQVPLLLAICVGLLAAPMFALKHYLVLIPILLEFWLIWRLRRDWRPFRPETILLAAGALAYAAAILLLTPDYLRIMVPALSLAYGDLRAPLILLFFNQMNLVLVICLFYFWHFRRELSAPAQAIMLVAAALVLSYYVQFKGWSYQVTPTVAALLLAVLLHIAQRPSLPKLRWSEQVIAAAIVLVSVWPGLAVGPYANGFAPYAQRLLKDARPGQSVVMITTYAAQMWGMVDQWELTWPSRYYHFWMMSKAANQLASTGLLSPEMDELVSRVRLETVEDFACNPPDILIADGMSVAGAEFDMLALFEAEPRFATLMQSYAETESMAHFTVYQRIAPLPAPTGPCMTIAPAH